MKRIQYPISLKVRKEYNAHLTSSKEIFHSYQFGFVHAIFRSASSLIRNSQERLRLSIVLN